jgi:hypothetical protein
MCFVIHIFFFVVVVVNVFCNTHVFFFVIVINVFCNTHVFFLFSASQHSIVCPALKTVGNIIAGMLASTSSFFFFFYFFNFFIFNFFFFFN